jgi:hypothetical protein
VLQQIKKQSVRNRGRSSDKQSARATVGAFLVSSPVKEQARLRSRKQKRTKQPSMRALAEATGLPRALLHASQERRCRLTEGETGVYWVGIRKRAGKRKVTEQLLALMKAFVFNHPNVRVSPNSRDTLKLPDESGVKVTLRNYCWRFRFARPSSTCNL